MITRSRVCLYERTKDYARISIYLYKSNKIRTNWSRRSKRVEQLKEKYEINKKIMCGLKINGCAICGYNKCNNALDFHHVNPQDRKFHVNLARMGYMDDKITEELNKCMLLCANCHREVEYKEKIYDK